MDKSVSDSENLLSDEKYNNMNIINTHVKIFIHIHIFIKTGFGEIHSNDILTNVTPITLIKKIQIRAVYLYFRNNVEIYI